MAKYIDINELYSEYNKSKEQGQLSSELRSMFKLMINSIFPKFNNFNYSAEQKFYKWKAEDLLNKYWQKNLDSPKLCFQYYTEIIKRGFAFAHKNLEEVKKEYLRELRKEKINKIYAGS
jgi:hypothetical protein